MILDNITFIVKTFKRYNCLDKFLTSCYQFFPDAQVYIADDNDDKEYNQYFYRCFPKAKVFRMPFDSGLSAGRNLLIDRSKRPFIFLLDDDFIFTEKTRLDKFADIMNSDKKIGIVGGVCVESGQETHYEHWLELKGGILRHTPDGDKWETRAGVRCKQTGCVLNFSLIRRNLFRDVKWDDDLKIVEHSDFFLQLNKYKNKWKIYFTPEVSIIHLKVRDEDYSKYRMRWQMFFTIFFKKWGIHKLVDMNGHTLELLENDTIKKGYEPPKN